MKEGLAAGASAVEGDGCEVADLLRDRDVQIDDR